MDAAAKPEPFADGIYFGLPEDPYHADPALGSTAIKTLAKDPTAWWWASSLNPNRPEPEDKPHFEIGKAVHKYVLEGPAAFAELFERGPEGQDLLRTSDELAAWLKATSAANAPAMKAISLSASVAASKPARIAQIKDLCERLELPLPRIVDLIEADAAERGVTLLKPADFDRIVAAGSAVVENPHLAGAFVGGYPEVSVFWTEEVDGELVRRKARFDYLKPRALVDLKSTRPRADMPFPAGCRRALAEYNYPAQAAAYAHGRMRVPQLVAEGRVFGDVDPAWLAKLAAAEGFGFVFVFWSNAGCPQTWGGVLSLDEELLAVGEVFVRDGLQNFVNWRRACGTERPWIEYQPLEEITIDQLPKWYGADA